MDQITQIKALLDEKTQKDIDIIKTALTRAKADLEEAQHRLLKLTSLRRGLVVKSSHVNPDDRERNDRAIFLMRGRIEDAEDDLKRQKRKHRAWELEYEQHSNG